MEKGPMMLRHHVAFSLIVVGVFLAGRAGRAEPGGYGVAWKLATTGVWPPAVVAGKMVLKNGDTLTAHSLADGREVWKKKLDSLRYGAGVLDAGGRYVYVLGGNALYLLDPADGRVVKRKPMRNPSYVYYYAGSVYVVLGREVRRYDHSGDKVIAKAKGYSGEIRGADGDYVVLYTHVADDPRTSPKRLIVVNLRTGKKTYEFKLLPAGWHRVIRTGRGHLVFIDYSQRKGDGTNPKKLYFTEADYVRSKKVRDQALHKKHPASYGSGAGDTFWAATDASGIVFIGNHGAAGDPAHLMAYDPGQDKVLWSRGGAVLTMGLLLHKGKLWTGVTDREGEAHAVAYSPDDGSQIVRLPLDAPGTGQPVKAGQRVLLRTRDSVYCFAPGTAVAPAVSPGVTDQPIPTKARPGWRLYRDRTAGYLIQTPRAWRFDRAKLIKMGGLRMSIPFVRTAPVKGKNAYLGSVHVLTWEAAGRDADALWRSVYTQRKHLARDVRVLKVYKVNNVGGSGVGGVKAVYTFRSPSGYPVQMRSMCVVSHGVAFELRGWAGPQKPAEIWEEIEGILASFRPHRFR
jgi:hypothetical protein